MKHPAHYLPVTCPRNQTSIKIVISATSPNPTAENDMLSTCQKPLDREKWHFQTWCFGESQSLPLNELFSEALKNIRVELLVLLLVGALFWKHLLLVTLFEILLVNPEGIKHWSKGSAKIGQSFLEPQLQHPLHWHCSNSKLHWYHQMSKRA